ncbi:hypothetical protein [Thermococcus sp.]
MKRVLLVLCVAALLVLSFVGVAVASESYIVSTYQGASMNGPATVVNHGNWTSAPKNPNVIYIAVWTPNPYKEYIEAALVNVVKKHGLKPVVVENITAHDFKGRVVLFYGPIIGYNGGVLSKTISISGILYYSYAGDARSAVDTINNGLEFSESAISNSANRLCQVSMNRLIKLRIANQTCDVAYWWYLKARVGKLSNANPYEMIASEIASQLDQFLRGS